MDKCTLILLLLIVNFEGKESLPISGFRLTPPENVWARIGEMVTLRCKSDKPIRSCAWITPYDKNYVLEEGLKAEGGRLSYYSSEEEDPSNECGIRIRAIENQDLGKWSCNIGVVEDNEIKSATGQASIRLASPPSDILLTFSPQVELNGTVIEPKASCEVKYASPKPKFEWRIDGESVVEPEVSDFYNGDESYIQILTNLKDVMESENATLTCVVSHMALNESLSESVDIYVEEDESFLDDMGGVDATMDIDYLGLLEDEDSLDDIPILIVIVVAIAITLIGIVILLHRRGKLNGCQSRSHEVIDLDKDGNLEGKINHHIDDSESTDSIVKQVPSSQESESSSSSTSDEEKKDLPEKEQLTEINLQSNESNSGTEIINNSRTSSKDNDVTLTVNRFLSKFSLKNIIPHPSMVDNKEDETEQKIKDEKDSNEEII